MSADKDPVSLDSNVQLLNQAANGQQDSAGGTKSSIACDRCRLKKIKCDGKRPCKSCTNCSSTCHYACNSRRHRGPAKKKARLLEERLEHAENLLRAAGLNPSSRLSPTSRLSPSPPARSPLRQPDPTSVVPAGETCAPSPIQASNLRASDGNEVYNVQTDLTVDAVSKSGLSDTYSCSLPQYGVDQSLSALLTPSISSIFHDQQDQIASTQPDSNYGYAGVLSAETTQTLPGPGSGDAENPPSRDEHHGPYSYLSICLDPGMEWITSRVRTSTFRASATSLLSTISDKLKLHGRITKQRTPDPDRDQALLYTRLFFDESLEATYGVVDRASFKAHLNRQFNHDPRIDEDFSWYALRNTVYAIGCRIHVFKTQSWVQAQKVSRGYFENALRVETDLLHGATGLMTIRALLLMSFFAEGAGSPKVEYMLVGCVLRLAYAKGLHLRPTSSKIAPEAAQSRSWLFWTIYCMEKHLALRAGRPSLIDDDDINCDLPTWAPGSNPNFVEYFKQSIHSAMLTSMIIKNFTTVKARERPLLQKVKQVRDFDLRVRRWYEKLPSIFKQDFSSTLGQLPVGLRVEHMMHLHFAYHSNLSAIHSVFGYPWNLLNEKPHSRESLEEQAISSSDALAQASRAIILAIRSVCVDAATPTWLTFYYPLVGMINLFVSALKSPASESTTQDIGLIEMAAGHFAYLEYATQSTVSVPCVRSLAHWAREAVIESRAAVEPTVQTEIAHHDLQPSFASQFDCTDLPPFELEDFAVDPTGYSQWPTFLPRLPNLDPWS